MENYFKVEFHSSACHRCASGKLLVGSIPPPPPPVMQGTALAELSLPLSSLTVGYGMAYDVVHNRLVVGSMTTGRIAGVALPSALPLTTVTEADTFTYYEGGADSLGRGVFAATGLLVDASSPCTLYVAVGSVNKTRVAERRHEGLPFMGVASVSLCGQGLLAFTDLSSLAVPGGAGAWANDLAQVGSTLYVTDSVGGQVFKVERQGDSAGAVVSKLFSLPSANGIAVTADGSLLVSSLSFPQGLGSHLYKYSPATGHGGYVGGTASLLRGDGMKTYGNKGTVLSGFEPMTVASCLCIELCGSGCK